MQHTSPDRSYNTAKAGQQLEERANSEGEDACEVANHSMTLVLPLNTPPAMDMTLDPCCSRPSLAEVAVSSRPPLAEPSAPRAAQLRLPDIRPPPSPTEQEMRLRSQMQDAADQAREWRSRSAGGYGTASAARVSDRTRSRQRPAVGLEDFLNDAPRRPGRTGRQPRAARPTQRQAIDDDTTVPPEVFDSMLRLGQEARSRATHTMAFAQPDGRPYLRHHNAEELLAAAQQETAEAVMYAAASDPLTEPDNTSNAVDELTVAPSTPSPLPMLPSRPPSSCASEIARSPGWDTHVEAMAMQVG